jgi:pimeloyl-ACP methyl ester carboxylesterase
LPHTLIASSPLLPETTPVRIFYRETGRGIPLVFLHGGWGYEVYPFSRQVEEFEAGFRILIPDRSGYGRSYRMDGFPIDFHRRAAVEMEGFLESLDIKRPVLWGHSDGAVISAMMALRSPDLYSAIILEAFHYYRVKPGSRQFFETMASDPLALGERVSNTLARDHGDDYWQQLIVNNGRAWLRIAEESERDDQDLYGGRLSEVAVPTLFLHGSRDPRTEPGELDAVRSQLPQAHICIIEGGGHSPHSESASAARCNRVAADFLRETLGDLSP